MSDKAVKEISEQDIEEAAEDIEELGKEFEKIDKEVEEALKVDRENLYKTIDI